MKWEIVQPVLFCKSNRMGNEVLPHGVALLQTALF